jgi:site-specific DNA-adenine methylase
LPNKLVSPCTYQGAKQRVCKEIVDIIFSQNLINNNTQFYDLCCGSGSVTIELLNRGIKLTNITMLDKSSWGKFWKSIGDGSFKFETFLQYADKVPRDKNLIQQFMKDLSTQNANIDEEYKYILLQASSFGGKQIWNENGIWKNTSFRDYWQPTATSSRRSPVNPMQPMIEPLIERVKDIVENCKGLTCIHGDIFNIIPLLKNKDNCIIYIDPPYSNTTKYGFNFSLKEFLDELFFITPCPIYVSEKEKISAESFQLKFEGSKGGISGVKQGKNEEWLNVFR